MTSAVPCPRSAPGSDCAAPQSRGDVEFADQLVRGHMEPTRHPDGTMQWKLQRNCAMAPGQLMVALSIIMLPSILIAVAFMLQGIPWVSLFCGIELLVLAIAFVCYARNAGDVQWIRVSSEHVEVKVRAGWSERHERFQRAFLKMSLCENQDNLLRIQESGRSVALGHHLPRHLRQDFYQAVRQACRV